MTKHDCPECRCDERPECVERHCLHPSGSLAGFTETWFCCRCPYKVTYSVDVSPSSTSSPPRGCKLFENVVVT